MLFVASVRPTHSSPERQAALQAGVAALVRAATPPRRRGSPQAMRSSSPSRSPRAYVPPLNLPGSPRARSAESRRNDLPSRRGVLIPDSQVSFSHADPPQILEILPVKKPY